jgi:hypothetical protein
MLTETSTKPVYVNAPNSGAIFTEANSSRVFGRLQLGGSDQRIEGALDIDEGRPVLKGRVLTAGEDFRIKLSKVEAEGKAPNWIGTLTSNDDPDFKRRVLGWTNQSRMSGREYIRLQTKA